MLTTRGALRRLSSRSARLFAMAALAGCSSSTATSTATTAANAAATTTRAPSTSTPSTAAGAATTGTAVAAATTAATVTVAPTTASNTATATLGPVPDALSTLEARAEDVIDLVPDGGWAKIAREVDTMRTTWDGFRATAVRVDTSMADLIDRALSTLADAAKAKAGAATTQAANDASAPLIELLSHYDVGHPVQVGRLDVIGRQIVIDADGRDLAAAGTRVAAARTEWTAVRADVLTHDGAKVAARADAALDALQRAVDARDATTVSRKATELLEIVDTMEGLY